MSKQKEKSNIEKEVEIAEKPLGLVQGTLYGVGCGIGGSIFILLGGAIEVAGPGVLISLALGGILIFLTALNYSELSASLPYFGGGYNFSKEALGGFLAYIIGFFLWIANIGTCVFSSLAFSLVLYQMFPILESAQLLIAIISTIFITVVVFRTQDIAIKSLIGLTIVILIIFGFFSLSGFFIAPITNESNFNPEFLLKGFSIFGMIQMFSLLFISYTSITSNLAHLNPILKNRSKNIPRVNMLAISITAIIYLIVTTVVLINLGGKTEDLVESPILLAQVLNDILGPFGYYLMGTAGIISTLIAMNAALGSATNVLHALARDRYITEKIEKVNNRTQVPIYSLIITSIVSIIIILIIDINIAAEMTVFIYFFGLAFVNFAAVILRYKRKELDRPFKAPLFPYLPIIIGASCLIFSFVLSFLAIIIGLMIFFIGLTYYLIKLADRHSIVITIAGIKFFSIIIIGIFIFGLNNYGVLNSSVTGGVDIFQLILLRIFIFFGIFAIFTVILDIVPLREFAYFFVKRIDKEKVAITIGGGQIIELKRKHIKVIYYINILIGILQFIGACFSFLLAYIISTKLITIESIIYGSTSLSKVGSEFLYITIFIIFGLGLLFSSISQLYYNRELKIIGV
ncbi:MAG: amino acid permease [Promethearchaeota archaeon]|nr:MAG: amino acid permease [Candidatus Lokiarchaeota archaeon]